MHPILARAPRRWLFMAIWTPAGPLMTLVPFWRAGGGTEGWWAIALWGAALAIPVLASWYVSRFTPAPRAQPGRTRTSGLRVVLTISAAAVSVAAAWVGAGRVALWTLAPADWAPNELFPAYAPAAFANAVAAFTMMSAVHYGLGAADASEAALTRLYRAEVAAREAELRALRAQVNPHFLFNCLHSIGALVTSSPDGARRMCLELAGFFRDSLRAGAQTRIPLGTEAALVRQYLAIERVRFGERLNDTVTIAPEAESVLVPPLVLQPLVENAVRHGIATLIDGGDVRVDIARRGDRVEIVIENPYDEEARRGGTALGLANVRARLETTYGDRARFRLDAAGGRFTAALSLPVEGE